MSDSSPIRHSRESGNPDHMSAGGPQPRRTKSCGSDPAAATAWRTGRHYFRMGLAVLGDNPWLYVRLLTIFSVPAALAAVLTVLEVGETPSGSVALFFLNAVSSSVAPVVIMVTVAAGFAKERLGVVEAIRSGLAWLLRYLWTNAHTTVIFWVPVGALILLFNWQGESAPLDATGQTIADFFWFLGIALVALYIHSRTLLAPFLAVHENMPGTLAALESWRLSGRYFPKVFGVFIVSSAPTAVPLAVVIIGLLLILDSGPKSTMLTVIPSLTWVAIKFVRPFLVTATYPLQKDLWIEERRRRDEHGHPALPRVLIPLVKLSAFLPRILGRAIGRDVRWSL